MNNAVYGVIFSMVVCACSIAIFTGHLLMLAVVSVTISGEGLYLFGWLDCFCFVYFSNRIVDTLFGRNTWSDVFLGLWYAFV